LPSDDQRSSPTGPGEPLLELELRKAQGSLCQASGKRIFKAVIASEDLNTYGEAWQSHSAAATKRVHSLVRRKWSPEQVSRRLRKFRRLDIAAATVYRMLAKERAQGGSRWVQLRQLSRRCAIEEGAGQAIPAEEELLQEPDTSTVQRS
jgi:IS30 family transposase